MCNKETAQQQQAAEQSLTIMPAVTANPIPHTPSPADQLLAVETVEVTAGFNQDARMHDKAFNASPPPAVHPAYASVEKAAATCCTDHNPALLLEASRGEVEKISHGS
jgi:hypothetical protein